MPDKVDLKKLHKALFAPKKTPQIVDVPPLQYLMIDGEGAPESPAFADAIAALYPAAYTLKFHCKTSGKGDFVVAPLEALWWADNMAAFVTNQRDDWQWTAMIMQPDFVSADDLAVTMAALEKKKKRVPLHDQLRLETLEEGKVVQVMHIGPFSDEGPVIANMHAFAEGEGHALTGKHHEIYLTDMRRTAPEKLKTVLRQPVT
ncbi:unnamed protein product [Laminaria digitata]